MNEKQNRSSRTPVFSEVNRCHHTNSHFFDYDRGEVVCTDCGCVLDDQMLYTKTERRSCESGKMLGTEMGNIKYDASGKRISASGQETYARLRRRARELGYSEKKNISRAFAELNRLAGRLQIRKLIKVQAEIIYRKAQKEGLVQGRSILGAAAAAIYAACREGGTPITLREISEVSLSNKKEIARDYRLFCKELGLQIRSVDSAAFFSKIAEGAKISNAAQGLARTLLKGAKNKCYCSGKHPSGLVASALHIASLRCSEKKTEKEISEAAGVSDTTVRHNCVVLRKIYAGVCSKEE